MKFKAIESTADGRVTAGKIYVGAIVYKSIGMSPGIRVAILDDKHEWTTFNPDIFRPEE